MTPSEVDLKVVDDRLQAVGHYLERLRDLPADRQEFLADHRNPNSAESLLRRCLEALLDVARHLLAKGYGKGPLEYREVARLARAHGMVENAATAAAFERMAGFRNRLTHFYREVTPEELFAVVARHLGDIETLADELRATAGKLAGTRSSATFAEGEDPT
jgi:uncharacterized protein YutE (UPF0331/DUF86 family)